MDKAKWFVLNYFLLLIKFSVYPTSACLGLLFLQWVDLLVLEKAVDVLEDLESLGTVLISALQSHVAMAMGTSVPADADWKLHHTGFYCSLWDSPQASSRASNTTAKMTVLSMLKTMPVDGICST